MTDIVYTEVTLPRVLAGLGQSHIS